ncbi:hypothetical protein DUQ60_25900 [Salmonella enterica subsp. enterica]|nr:hypothetical protein [Salmonella enterica subsp. enterica serovar Lattenkamp]EBK5137453.1 hypothetical protein [Salmonella enterica]EBY0816114.1 hypothetical protein [Salmonella enterica subsp. enterica serovar Lattenkamp]
MNKYIIFFPFGYTYISRIKNLSKFISFLLTIPIPCFLFFYYGLVSSENKSCFTGLIFIWSYINLYIFYENGYIENDIKTVKKEENPTLRIVGDLYHFIDNNYYKIISIRVVFFVISILLLFFVSNCILILKLSLLSLATALLYYFHNNIRSVFKVLTFFCLSSSRFIFPLLVCSDLIAPEKFNYILLSIFIYTIPASLIYSAKSFKLIRFLLRGEYKYKILYYTFTSFIFMASYFLYDKNDISLFMFFLLLYMSLLICLKKVINR